MKLHAHIPGLAIPQALVARVATTVDGPLESRSREVLLIDQAPYHDPAGFALVLRRAGASAEVRHAKVPESLDFLQAGDIVRITPVGDITALYRKASPHNAIFVTERCNSRCIMCSQPPRDVNDDYLIREWLEAIPLMSPDTRELGITGGEPTLQYGNLLALIEAVKTHLPSTALHLLTNGRLFSYLKYAQRFAACDHPDLMIGIPLYSDIDSLHDFVVQAKGAFAQTVAGILNLARVRQKIEIRFVVHRHTYERLPHFARYVARNLPFVNHVALMGLELMGYARTNLNSIWIDPTEYHQQLEEAVAELTWAGIRVSIYNLPLCLVPQSLWVYARQSISDWKNTYVPECENCAVKEFCSGFFISSDLRRSVHVRALGGEERNLFVQQTGRACDTSPENASRSETSGSSE